MSEEIKEINIKIDRVLDIGFSMICVDEVYIEYCIKEGKVCNDCGKPVDGFIEIIPLKKEGESSEDHMNRRYRLCKDCYATEKYVPMKPKEVEPDGCKGCDGSCGCIA